MHLAFVVDVIIYLNIEDEWRNAHANSAASGPESHTTFTKV